MPLVINKSSPNGSQLILWKNTEPEEYYRERCDIREGKLIDINTWAASRRHEWLAGRYLIQSYAHCSSRDLIIDQYGKPHTTDPQQEISLTHSHEYICLMIDHAPCGIDIQKHVAKIDRIIHKFSTAGDYHILCMVDPMDQAHYIWCAKEAIYKAYGKRSLDFRQHIHITSCTMTGANQATMRGKVSKDETVINYELRSLKINELYITTAIEETAQ